VVEESFVGSFFGGRTDGRTDVGIGSWEWSVVRLLSECPILEYAVALSPPRNDGLPARHALTLTHHFTVRALCLALRQVGAA